MLRVPFAVRRLSRPHRGQAAVETAIVFPTLIFFILGIIQLGLMQQARLMLEYAAYSAARVGAVWNADPKMMNDAALFTLTPTFGIAASQDMGLGAIHGADSWTSFAKTYGTFLAAEKLGSILPGGLKPVRVDILNPTTDSMSGNTELDFDDPGNRLNTQLTVRVVYLYNMRIPFANWIIWQAMMGQRAGMTLVQRVDGWYYAGVEFKDKALWEGLETAAAKGSNCAYNGLTTSNYHAIGAASLLGFYLMPLVTTYTIRMQSNPLLKNLQPRSKVFPGC
jgi:hypothetical protein